MENKEIKEAVQTTKEEIQIALSRLGFKDTPEVTTDITGLILVFENVEAKGVIREFPTYELDPEEDEQLMFSITIDNKNDDDLEIFNHELARFLIDHYIDRQLIQTVANLVG